MRRNGNKVNCWSIYWNQRSNFWKRTYATDTQNACSIAVQFIPLVSSFWGLIFGCALTFSVLLFVFSGRDFFTGLEERIMSNRPSSVRNSVLNKIYKSECLRTKKNNSKFTVTICISGHAPQLFSFFRFLSADVFITQKVSLQTRILVLRHYLPSKKTYIRREGIPFSCSQSL